MSRHVNSISGRLSLRTPQRQSLEILHRVMEIAQPHKHGDLQATLSVIRSEFATVEDFERSFPSLCFALATGVGKTRLMGAFITYLHLEYGIRHFFVLAPNLTIYKKLVADFTPNTPKYVFQGIAEFAVKSPSLVTGENFEQKPQILDLFERDDVVVNVFNISKFNVRANDSRKIRRLSEFLGESYFDYLAGLDDLVLIMDEAHRYRADSSMKSIEELKPVLGLELTATPQVESSNKPTRFKNVIFDYPLAQAMRDGYVKEPAVATRANFNPASMSPSALERLKLEDGIRVHASTATELDVYARQNDVRRVKPFMLVIATDTDHANALVKLIEGDSFFEGQYKGKVIQVHSGLKGAEKDDNVERLLAVERPDEQTEIVVHVNMLKEGWDVTNLYTIVPLRAADSRTLVEQSIGRGLRLPYGKRTGHLAASAQYMDYALRHVTPNESAATIANMKSALEKIRPKVGGAKVIINEPTAQLRVDGQAVDHDPKIEVFLDPGKHVLQAVAGDRAISKAISVGAGETQTLEFELPPAAAKPSPPPASVAPRSSSHADAGDPAENFRSIALIGGAALAVAGMGTGIGFGVVSNSAEGDVEDYRARVGAGGCRGATVSGDCSALRDAADRQRRSTLIANVGYGVAAFGLVAVGVSLLWPQGHAAETQTARVELRWSGNGFSLGGTF